MGGRRGGYDGNRRGREMDRRSQGRFPNNRGQQKRDGAGKFNYGKEDENPQDTQQDWMTMSVKKKMMVKLLWKTMLEMQLIPNKLNQKPMKKVVKIKKLRMNHQEKKLRKN